MKTTRSCLVFSSPLTSAVSQCAATISNTSFHIAHKHTRPLSSSSRPWSQECKERRAGSRALRCQNKSNECRRLRRAYATVSGDTTNDFSHLQWPQAPRGHTHPTPYQIFALQESAPYTKHRFYELVKLYHPDRGGNDARGPDHIEPSSTHTLPSTHPCHNLCQSQKLERYRLIVAAHGILSDPAKRAAYDRFGAGWSGRPEANAATTPSPQHPRPGPFSGWREHSDPDIWANATWEDWERFRARRSAGDTPFQAPLYMRNSYFVTLLLMFALMGSTLNLGRAESNGEKFLEARDAMHDRASKELRRVRQQSESRLKEERIQWFLRQREATMMGLGVEEVVAEKARRMLPEQESCLGGMNRWGDGGERFDDKGRGDGSRRPD